jgi:1,4-dihydroxy-2-naphthoate octaprenyltransferase
LSHKSKGSISTQLQDSSGVTGVQAWLVAIRPRSLPVALGPVLVGAACAYLDTGYIDAVLVLLAFGAALMMQIISNLQNDVGYTVRRADSSRTRIGLPRATANGWLGVHQVRTAIVILSLLAAGLGIALVAYRGWPVLAIGAVSLLAALAYMGGPKPIAYTPFGELTVFVFFGLVAVCGTDWLLSGKLGMKSVLAATAVGSLAAAALAVNNHRDIDHDREVGRQTFAVVFGADASAFMFGVLVFFPFAVPLLLASMSASLALLLPLLLLPRAWRLQRDFRACNGGIAYNRILFRTFLLGLWFSSFLAVGAVVARIGLLGGY